MANTSRFDLIDGVPDYEQVEAWAEIYFQGLLQMMNGFYAQADMNEVLKSMQAIPFHRLATQELEGESSEVIALAMQFINEMAAREIDYMQAYLGLASQTLKFYYPTKIALLLPPNIQYKI
jgi:hypothetical protein